MTKLRTLLRRDRPGSARRRGLQILIPALLGSLSLLAVNVGVAQASESPCPNQAIRESGSSDTNPLTGKPFDGGLPDCRAYEQVSPAEKDSGSGGVFSFDSLDQAYGALRSTAHLGIPMEGLSDGSSITYGGEPFYQIPPLENEKLGVEGTPGRNYSNLQQYTSERSANVWNTRFGDTLGSEGAPTYSLPASASDPEHIEETPSGSDVFYIEAGDLYEYRPSSRSEPTDLTPIAGADVQGLLGSGGEGAEEGSYVYFVAGGVLAPGASGGGCHLENQGDTEGTDCNLYLRHDDEITFIAALSADDENEGQTVGAGNVDWSGPGQRTAEVSPSGRYVAFGSVLPLTQQQVGREIFRYDAETHKLTCVSCASPTSAEPQSGALDSVSTLAAVNGAGRQRYVLNDGRVLLDSGGALLEYEPESVGSCTSSTNVPGAIFVPSESGCIALIANDAVLADASADGSDIFFTTSQPLVPQDQDEITDLYDAREGGGFTPPPPPGCATAADCRLGTPPSTAGTSPTATSAGTEVTPAVLNLEEKPAVVKQLTRAQKLAKALKRCHKELAGRARGKRRASCERAARQKYAPKKPAKKSTNNGRAK